MLSLHVKIDWFITNLSNCKQAGERLLFFILLSTNNDSSTRQLCIANSAQHSLHEKLTYSWRPATITQPTPHNRGVSLCTTLLRRCRSDTPPLGPRLHKHHRVKFRVEFRVTRFYTRRNIRLGVTGGEGEGQAYRNRKNAARERYETAMFATTLREQNFFRVVKSCNKCTNRTSAFATEPRRRTLLRNSLEQRLEEGADREYDAQAGASIPMGQGDMSPQCLWRGRRPWQCPPIF